MISYVTLCKKTSTKLINNTDAKAIFDFLCIPENIHNMIVVSELGLPAISGIVKELEVKFENATAFLMDDAKNRQTVGKMVKYILGEFGYEPVVRRTQLRDFTGAKLFKTASVYAQNKHKKNVCSLSVQIRELGESKG
ncbi:MAG: hypothetical protein NC205_08585 [Prevotella sp.]|nr:hypothetical protein [Alistipes senegalensis]MCM1358641.1 hypothetical protein [Prevotella sp.]MCM1474590.1 hypothetical protein [Muribaculaceae bacterium]